MGLSLFRKPEVVIMKQSSDAKEYLEKLEELLSRAEGDEKEKIEKEIVIVKAGIVGEDRILFELKNSGTDMVVLQDLYIETKDELGAQIDFIVVMSKLVFLIECKNMVGDIEIDSKGNFIRTIKYGNKKIKEGIYSPITQNERHLTVLKNVRTDDKGMILGTAIRGNFSKFYKSLVVLSNPKTIVNDRFAKKEIKENVIRVDQLINVLKKKNAESKELSSSLKDMRKLAEGLLKKNKEGRREYIAKYKALVEEAEIGKKTLIEEKSIELQKLICPKCGRELVLRTAKKGSNTGQQFYGCTSFPKCRYIQNVK